MPIDVLCIGHAAFDISLYMENFPEENQKYEIREQLAGCGGPAANAALLLGRWGVSCAFAGVVGDDFYGMQIMAELNRCGVDTRLSETRFGHVTPVSTILVNKRSGSRTIINRKAAATPLKVSSDKLATLAPKVILADGHELPAALAAIQRCPKAKSILDAGSVREGTLALAGVVDALIVSERFARQATNKVELATEADQRDSLRQLQQRFSPDIAAITLGERGLIADWGQGATHIPAPAASVVDTTGAGDIFHGAAAYGMLQEWPWPRILSFAAQTAALSVTRRGGSQSIPDLAEVIENA